MHFPKLLWCQDIQKVCQKSELQHMLQSRGKVLTLESLFFHFNLYWLKIYNTKQTKAKKNVWEIYRCCHNYSCIMSIIAIFFTIVPLIFSRHASLCSICVFTNIFLLHWVLFLFLLTKTKLCLCLSLCVSQGLMDEAYKHIVHIYLKNLVRTSQSKLTKCWSPNVGQTVTEDAELLHRTMSDLVRSKF